VIDKERASHSLKRGGGAAIFSMEEAAEAARDRLPRGNRRACPLPPVKGVGAKASIVAG